MTNSFYYIEIKRLKDEITYLNIKIEYILKDKSDLNKTLNLIRKYPTPNDNSTNKIQWQLEMINNHLAELKERLADIKNDINFCNQKAAKVDAEISAAYNAAYNKSPELIERGLVMHLSKLLSPAIRGPR
jgi:chromosome segregation ATPase